MQKTLLLLAAVLFIPLGMSKAQAAPDVSVDFFYDQLGDYGDWVEVGDYGYGWQPRDVDPDWRPYSDGRWAYTDAGWTWISDEPYGWAVYHYGRWTQLEGRGWVWIPGTEWAPAWVSWRRSPQHVGWAPLPPEASFRHNVGLSTWVDSYYDIGPGAYRFVEARNFGSPHLRSVFIEPRENVTIINQTTNITNITYVNNEVNNGGPRYEDISRESAEPVRRLRLERRMDIEGDRASFRGDKLRPSVDGDSLRIFSPGFDARAAAPPARLAPRIQNVQVNHGWKDAGPAAEVEKLRTKVRAEAKAPKALPPQPKFEKLAVQTTPAAAASAPSASPETAAPVAPGGKPRDGKMKDPRTGKPAPAATPAAEARTAAESPSTSATPTPLKPQKPGKSGKPGKQPAVDAPATQPVPAETGAPATPAAEPASPKGKNRQRPETPAQVAPGDAAEPKSAPGNPELRNEPPSPRKERPAPPAGERPETTREVPPTAERPKMKPERPSPPAAAPGNAPQAATHPEAAKPKPGKGQPKGDKKPDDDAPKPQ